jgi:hypothetical protein
VDKSAAVTPFDQGGKGLRRISGRQGSTECSGRNQRSTSYPNLFLAPDDLDHLRLQGDPVTPEVGFPVVARAQGDHVGQSALTASRQRDNVLGFEVASAIHLEEHFLATVLIMPSSSLEDLSTHLGIPDGAAAWCRDRL